MDGAPDEPEWAYNRVKSIEGVRGIVNNIEVLPLGSSDMQSGGRRAALQRNLARTSGAEAPIFKIVVKNGKHHPAGRSGEQAKTPTLPRSSAIRCRSRSMSST